MADFFIGVFFGVMLMIIVMSIIDGFRYGWWSGPGDRIQNRNPEA